MYLLCSYLCIYYVLTYALYVLYSQTWTNRTCVSRKPGNKSWSPHFWHKNLLKISGVHRFRCFHYVQYSEYSHTYVCMTYLWWLLWQASTTLNRSKHKNMCPNLSYYDFFKNIPTYIHDRQGPFLKRIGIGIYYETEFSPLEIIVPPENQQIQQSSLAFCLQAKQENITKTALIPLISRLCAKHE